MPAKIEQTDVQQIVAKENRNLVAVMAEAESLKKVKELFKDKIDPVKLNSLNLFSPVDLTFKDSIIDYKAVLVYDSLGKI